MKTRLLALLLTIITTSTAMAGTKSHGLSAFGDLKYPADFKHFDYVNPQAPKSGRMTMIGPAGTSTFDSFNGYIIKGIPAQGLGYLSRVRTLFDSLMVRAYDEPDAVYGLVAHTAELSDDKKSVTFYMRPEAKFSDGTPVTAEDVAYTYKLLKEKGHPGYSTPLQDVVKAEVIDKHTIRYTFKGEKIRDLPRVVATLPIFSKAYYTKNEFDKTSLKPPLGSGPYLISKHKQGTSVTYKRRKDYWAKDLPVNVGQYNFNELRYEYFRDRNVEFEALKNGTIELREEFTSKVWMTQYNFDALKQGKVIRATLSDKSPSGAQGFFLNTRKPHLKDPRVREAIGLAFDFEWTNKNLFFRLYDRTHSYFENSDMKAEGLPSKEELTLLEPFRKQLPEAVFTKPAYSPPVSNGSGRDRKLLRKATKLLREAGWTVKDKKRVNAKGKQLKIVFLTEAQPTTIRIITPYLKNLKALGINASIRTVDPSQYIQRVKNFDFDIIIERFSMSLTPGVGLRNYMASENADKIGSNNLAGIKDPVVDALIVKAIKAKNRNELKTVIRALDRVLRAGHYWVPHWYKASHNVAYWNKFSAPKIKPDFARGIIDTWWYDSQKAKKK